MSEFYKVKCDKCKNEQIIFQKASKDINCLVCNELLANCTGGKILLKVKNYKLVE